MEKKSGYALIGLSALTLFIGLIVFVVWLAWLPFNREYELFDIVFVGPVRGLSEGGEVHFSGIKVGGSDLGFWFAQQGSILVFIVLIFWYAWRMNRLDAEHGVEE